MATSRLGTSWSHTVRDRLVNSTARRPTERAARRSITLARIAEALDVLADGGLRATGGA